MSAGHASPTSVITKLVEEVRDLAEIQVKLEIQDWQPLKFWDLLRETMKLSRRPLKRNTLVRLAALCIVGAWMRDMGD